MKTVLFAIIQVVITSGIFYGYYHLFLRNKRFHQYNRFYLLGATVISLLIPFLNIPVYFTPEEKASSFVWQTLSSIAASDNTVVVTSQHASTATFTTTDLLYCLYVLIALIIFTRMIVSLLKIRKLRRHNPSEQLEDIHFIVTKEPGTPFSFFRWLFWHKEIELHSEKGEQIFRHEMFHIRQKHSLDVIFMELVTIICWINPFFHLIRKEIKAIHEFLADQFAVKKNQEWDYAELLLMQVLNTNHSLVNPFFHNQIKRRIAMITSSQQPKYRYFRKILVLPLLALIAALFAFSYKQKKEADTQTSAETTLAGTANDQRPLAIEIREVVLTDTPKEKAKGKTETKLPGLYIVNGKQYTHKQLVEFFGDQVELKSGEIHVLPANDAGVIKKYGPLAKDGVAIVKSIDLSFPKADLSFPKADFKIGSPTGNPLIIIDDEVQVKGESKAILDRIKPDDIKEINILKDKSATAIYGEQGADGVIEILTKKDRPVQVKGVMIEDEKKQDSRLEEVKVTGYQLKLDKTPANETLKEVVIMDRVFEKLEVEPEFPGGESAWRKYLERNLNSEIPSGNGAPVGKYKVQVQFIVDEQGRISDIKPLTKNGYGMEEEVRRVLSAGPLWKPGMQNGKTVKAYKTQPIIFVVNEHLALKEVVVVGYDKPKVTDTKGYEKLNPIYPNPATNNVYIPYSSPAAGEGEIRVFDASGKLQMNVKTTLLKGANNLSINVTSLVKGIYFVEVAGADKNLGRRYKIVKE